MSEDAQNQSEESSPSGSAPPPPESTAPDPEPEVLDPLEAAQNEAKKLKDQLLRTAADFDNFRKRSRREIEEASTRSRDQTIKDLLPIFDNLERASAAAEGAAEVKSLKDGIEMVMKQFHDTLGRMNIERVQSVGQPFDPLVHEAIQQLETTEHPPGSIAAEVQAGYRADGRLVRAAMVVVAKAPAEVSAADESNDSDDGSSDGDAPESDSELN